MLRFYDFIIETYYERKIFSWNLCTIISIVVSFIGNTVQTLAFYEIYIKYISIVTISWLIIFIYSENFHANKLIIIIFKILFELIVLISLGKFFSIIFDHDFYFLFQFTVFFFSIFYEHFIKN